MYSFHNKQTHIKIMRDQIHTIRSKDKTISELKRALNKHKSELTNLQNKQKNEIRRSQIVFGVCQWRRAALEFSEY